MGCMGSRRRTERIQRKERKAGEMGDYAVRVLRPPSWSEIESLAAESREEGFRFLQRLRREYESGAVTFGAPGETLLGVYAGTELVRSAG
jgi:hypothetical protein